MSAAEAVESLKAAVEARRVDIFKSILDTLKKESGESTVADLINQQHTEQGTFLHQACEEGLSDMVRVLLTFGADPQIVNNQKLKPVSLAKDEQTKRVFHDMLFAAVAQHNHGFFEKIFAELPENDRVDNEEKRNSLLHWAASFGNFRAAKILVENAASIYGTNAEGLTPFHEAVRSGNPEIVELLLQNGADPLLPVQGSGRFSGKTSLDFAKPESALKILLESHVKPNGHQELVERSEAAERVQLSTFPSQDGLNHLKEKFSSVFRSQIKPVITDNRLHYLLPQPKEIQQLEGSPLSLEQPWKISFSGPQHLHQVLDIWDVHKPSFQGLGVSIGLSDDFDDDGDDGSVSVLCCVRKSLFGNLSGAYKITIRANHISIIAGDNDGLHYALTTLEQLVFLYSADRRIEPLFISDWPSLNMRGVLIDVSANGRIPTMETLFTFVDTWRFLKINQLHLFARISACQTSDSIWPYTKSELISLDRYCMDRGLQLVPALEFHADLKMTQFETLRDAVRNARKLFPATNYLHAGPQLSAILLENPGILEDFGTSVQWILCANSASLPNVNARNFPEIIFMEYGFQAIYNFHEATESKWQDSGALSFCAGTASWGCLAGYPDAAFSNIFHAAQASSDRGSLGCVVATWADSSPICPLTFAWPGWIGHAAFSWNTSIPWDFVKNFAGDLISLWILREPLDRNPELGQAIVELGRLETWFFQESLGESQNLEAFLPPSGYSSLYQLIFDPDSVSLDHLTPETILRALRHGRKWHKSLVQTPPSLKNLMARNALAEAIFAADLILLACSIGRSLVTAGQNPHCNLGIATINVGIANLPSTFRTDTANKLLALNEKFVELWSRQYVVPASTNGGFENIISNFRLAIKRLLGDLPTNGESEF